MSDFQILRRTADGRFMFFCPGCGCAHGVTSAWSFNGDFGKPTFSPSILVRGTQPITDEEHAKLMAGEHVEPRPLCCHSFVRDGEIQFLDDCTHALKGQTVPLEAF